MPNIQNTKNKLTLTFTIIVFVLILSFGMIFFTTKYVKGYTGEKNSFSRITQGINNDNIKLKSLLEFQEMRKNDPRIKGERGPEENGLLGRGGMNFILINSKSEILSHNIKVEVSDDFLEKIFIGESFSKVRVRNDFLITKIPFQEKYILVMFQKMKYTLGDYLADLILFLILGSLLSGLIYIIGRKFVNKTFVPVEENMDDMKNFIHNAGHELKTPLAVIDSNLQLSQDIKIYDKEMVGENRAEIKKLNSLIDSLIQLSDIDSLKGKEVVNLREISEEVIENYETNISDKDIKTKIEIDSSIVVSTHRDYLYILLSNIIGNAIKYNKKKGDLTIKYTNSTLIISDTGKGIPEGDIDKIWNRFYQAESSRNEEGFGIGLSLVKKISDIYKWKISLTSTEKEGTSVNIKF